MRTLITALACCTLAAPAASPAVRKVPQQYSSIDDAVAAANDGDVIKIAKGRYQESVSTSRSLTFQGEKGTIWDGFFSDNHFDHLSATANNVTVKGIEFQNGGTPVRIIGDNASVTGCTFRGSKDGVIVDGVSAEVSKNLFSGLQRDDLVIMIDGPGAVVDKNRVEDGAGAWISVDAEDAGSATVTNNVLDTSLDNAQISVSNATAPVVKKNKILNAYASYPVIHVANCDGALVSGNTLSNINYVIDAGIDVSGEHATVTKNRLEVLYCHSGDLACIRVSGGAAKITRNKVMSCGAAGDVHNAWGIYATGNDTVVEKNLVEDLCGGGDETFGIEVIGDDTMVAKNTVRNLTDKHAAGVLLSGNRVRAQKNKISKVMFYPLLQVLGSDFRIEDNVLKGSAHDSIGLYAGGAATSPGAAVILDNTVSNVGGQGMVLAIDNVIVRDNVVKHAAGLGCQILGNDNVLQDNQTSDSLDDGFNVVGAGNSLSNCSARSADRDGFDITGNLNTLNKCQATDCAAEGLDNGDGTSTTAANCTLKGSRIDYAGDGGMINDSGTTYQTGGPGTVPEID
ncbi:MAG: hypothetical protein HY812_12225 [Planctomycetes bacterium]|nr:hypothetical protein [Planctomycetota bacterium]